MYRHALFLTGAFCLTAAEISEADQPLSNPLIDNGKLTLTNKNFFFYRDFRHGNSNSAGINATKPPADRNGYAEEWAQGFMLDYQSGFTPGLLGFGIDAQGALGLKLNSGGGTTGLRLLPDGSDGKPDDSYSRAGGALKARLSKSTLKYGQQMPMTPVLAVNTVRLFPSLATGLQLNVNEFDNFSLESGHFTRQTGVDSSNENGRFTTDYALKRNGKAITYDSASFIGGRYQNNGISLSLYAGQLEDAWHQYYGNAKYTYPIDQGRRLNFDLNVYRTLNYGKSLAGPINNTSWSVSSAYTSGAHTISLIHQQINGDEPLDWIGFGTMGGTVTIGNAVQYATFSEANERSWQLRYDVNFAAFGIPGLTMMARYVRGDDIDNSHSNNPFYTARYVYDPDKDNKHWERDFDIRYVIQSGPASGVSFRLRQATHRATTGYRYVDIDEIRLITEFPIDIF
jgi:imipenem/basic amino acid-specific outer membrane pore